MATSDLSANKTSHRGGILSSVGDDIVVDPIADISKTRQSCSLPGLSVFVCIDLLEQTAFGKKQ